MSKQVQVFHGDVVIDGSLMINGMTLSQLITNIAGNSGSTYYTVTYDSNGGSAIASVSALAGSSVTLPTATKTGYALDGWTLSDGETFVAIAGAGYVPTADITLKAKWTATSVATYTVTFKLNGLAWSSGATTDIVVSGLANGTNLSAIDADDVTSGLFSDLNNTLTVPNGKTFSGWFTSGDGVMVSTSTAATGITYAVTANVILTAIVQGNQYQLTQNANGGVFTTVPGSTETYVRTVTYGATVNALLTPSRTGYVFSGWYTAVTGGAEVTPYTVYSTAGNSTIYAHWTAENDVTQATITVNAELREVTGGIEFTAITSAPVPTIVYVVIAYVMRDAAVPTNVIIANSVIQIPSGGSVATKIEPCEYFDGSIGPYTMSAQVSYTNPTTHDGGSTYYTFVAGTTTIYR